jgi:hypothetical protein
MEPRRNIKLHSDIFEKLRDNKPRGVTWDYYIMSLIEEPEDAD